jgi:hypothetical protein
LPLELFRWRLTQMVDALLHHLERHPEYRCFNLDGQTIVIDDYLTLRPESRERLSKLIREGRIVIGPWWVQPDEWLPSAESHVRNLQLGIREAEALGGCMMIGHCADQFGHIAQLPQILSQLELTSACLWRGVSDDVPGWSFWWEAPDGTRLPVLYLRQSYSNGVNLPRDPVELDERIRESEADRRGDEPLLLMNGSDHTFFEPEVPDYLRTVSDAYRPEIGTLVDYQRAMFAAGVDEFVHQGELRSTNRSNILVGVLSARMNIKQRDFEVSAALERYAEPLEFLANTSVGYDGLPALKFAWRVLLENAPHDSICGCSIDQTHREMLPRFDRAEQLAERVIEESVASLLPRLDSGKGAIAVWRPVQGQPTPFTVKIPAAWVGSGFTINGVPLPTSEAEPSGGELLSERSITVAAAIRQIDGASKGTVHGRRVQTLTLEDIPDGLRMAMTVGDGFSLPDYAEVRARLQAALGDSETRVRYTIHSQPVVEAVGILPPSDSIELAAARRVDEPPFVANATRARRGEIANEFYSVRFGGAGLELTDLHSGAVHINLNDYGVEGDRGDEYNADIAGSIVAAERHSLLETESNGIRTALTYNSELEVSRRLTAARDGREGEATIRLTTRVMLWAGIRRVDFEVFVENEAEDMRLRALFPLPFQTRSVITEGHFHVATRTTEPEPWNGRSAERPTATFPQKTFAAVERNGAGVAVFNRGLPEGEVVDRGGIQSYALTLLRAVGWLSRPDLGSREGGAGPTIPTFDSQMPGSHRFQYAWTTYAGSWEEAEIQAKAHAFAFPPVAWPVSGFSGANERIAAARIDGATFSALHRSHLDGAPIVRVYRASDQAGTAHVDLPLTVDSVESTNLLERQANALGTSEPGTWETPLRPWQIATFRMPG